MRLLSHIAATPTPASSREVTASTTTVRTPLPGPPAAVSVPVVDMPRRLLRLGQETGLLHQLLVARFFARQPLAERLAGQGRGVEGALLHQFRPFRGFAHLFHDRKTVV